LNALVNRNSTPKEKNRFVYILAGKDAACRDIAQACTACDSGKVNGKIVVEL